MSATDRALVMRACAAVIAVAGIAPSVWAVPEPARGVRVAQPQNDDRPGSLSASATQLTDPEATDATRLAAAEVLVQQSESSSNARELLAKAAESGSKARLAIAGAVSRQADASARLYPMVAEWLSRADKAETLAWLEALGSFRSRESARVLLRHAGGDEPRERSAAFAALRELSGRDDIADDEDAWGAWFDEIETLTETQWRLRLLASTSRRVQRLEQERGALSQRLVESLRQLHLATEAQERPKFLATLLLDPIPSVQSLGFELVSRELAAKGSLDGPVGEAAVRLLGSPEATTRASAAVLVRRLAPAGAEEAVMAAIQNEEDPRAAADLLLAALRWPRPELVAPAVRWLREPGPAQDAATEAAYWLFRAGQITVQSGGEALAALRTIPIERLTPAGVQLRAYLGDEEDWSDTVRLLESKAAAVQLAAAEALLWQDAFLDDIIDAARTDPDLFEVAARGVLLYAPTGGAMRTLLELPKPSMEVWRPALLRVASAVPAPELLSVLEEMKDAALRRGCMMLLVSPERMMSESGNALNRTAMAQAALLLARSQLESDEPEAAIATLEVDVLKDDEARNNEAQWLRAAALVAIGRPDLIDDGGNDPVAWVMGMERVVDEARLGDLLKAFDERFGNTINPSLTAQLEAIRAQAVKVDADRGKTAPNGVPVGPVPDPGEEPKPADPKPPSEPKPADPGPEVGTEVVDSSKRAPAASLIRPWFWRR